MNFHAAGSIMGRNGTMTRPITVPVVMITPKVVSRSARSDFRSAFQLACMSAANSSSPTISGETTIGARSPRLVVGILDRHPNVHGIVVRSHILVGAYQDREPVVFSDLLATNLVPHRSDWIGGGPAAGPENAAHTGAHPDASNEAAKWSLIVSRQEIEDGRIAVGHALTTRINHVLLGHHVRGKGERRRHDECIDVLGRQLEAAQRIDRRLDGL